VWSPDGALIAFTAVFGGGRDIYLMTPEGSDLRLLTRTPGDDHQPDWSPDGRRLAFACEMPESVEVCLINADASGLVRLTINDVADSAPGWRPPLP
jgi:TolB protein